VQLRALPVDAAIDGNVDLANLALAGPGQPADFVSARTAQRFLRAGEGDDGFRVDQPRETARAAVGHQVGIFRRLFARVPGPLAELDPAQPFDAYIAFPARHHQPQRKTLVGP